MPVEWNESLLPEIEAGAYQGIVMGTNRLSNEGNRLIRSGSRTGRIYRRRGVTHQASAPGEPPAFDIGRLTGSARQEFDRNLLQGTAIWSTGYALRLELGFFGTDSRGRRYQQEPRPFARPALENTREAITKDVFDGVNRALRSAGTPGFI